MAEFEIGDIVEIVAKVETLEGRIGTVVGKTELNMIGVDVPGFDGVILWFPSAGEMTFIKKYEP